MTNLELKVNSVHVSNDNENVLSIKLRNLKKQELFNIITNGLWLLILVCFK